MKDALYAVWLVCGAVRTVSSAGPTEAAILIQASAIREGLDFAVDSIRNEETGQMYTIDKVKALAVSAR